MYLDSAILVKLLVREADSDWFGHRLSGHRFESSELAMVEVCRALLFKESKNEITSRERVSATEKFLSMAENKLISLLALNRQVLDRARAIQLACHPHIPLRSLDALHVATCDLNRCSTMAATDRRIRAACKQLGINLIPGESEDIATTK
jgi:predicted nucleic acid-binding protein